MTETFARFRELKGVGPATESRLHDAGVWSWQDLAGVLHALGGIRGISSESLRTLEDESSRRAEHVSSDAAPEPGDGPRAEAFIVRLTIGSDGTVSRTSVTHARTRDEQSWAGWHATAIGRLIGWVAGVEVDHDRSLQPEGEAAPSGARAVPAGKSLVVELGVRVRAFGHSRQLVDAVIPVEQVESLAADNFSYVATLQARPFGHDDDADWDPLGILAGHGRPNEPITLRFDDVVLADDVSRLRVALDANPLTEVLTDG